MRYFLARNLKLIRYETYFVSLPYNTFLAQVMLKIAAWYILTCCARTRRFRGRK
jgi:hypothetical protein